MPGRLRSRSSAREGHTTCGAVADLAHEELVCGDQRERWPRSDDPASYRWFDSAGKSRSPAPISTLIGTSGQRWNAHGCRKGVSAGSRGGPAAASTARASAGRSCRNGSRCRTRRYGPPLVGSAAGRTGSGGIPPLARSLAGFGDHRVQQDDHRDRLADHGRGESGQRLGHQHDAGLAADRPIDDLSVFRQAKRRVVPGDFPPRSPGGPAAAARAPAAPSARPDRQHLAPARTWPSTPPSRISVSSTPTGLLHAETARRRETHRHDRSRPAQPPTRSARPRRTTPPNIRLWRAPNGHAHMLTGEQNGGSRAVLGNVP